MKLVPQGRLPSMQDVDTQYTLQRTFGPTCNLMLIMNETGVTNWTLPHATMMLMWEARGESSRLAVHPNDLVANATFVNFLREGAWDLEVHTLGQCLAVEAGQQQPVPQRYQVCAPCVPGHQSEDGGSSKALDKDPIERGASGCHACGNRLGLEAKFCNGCGQAVGKQCASCSALLGTAAKFCSQCGTPCPSSNEA